MARNRFVDPATGESYIWEINDSEVEAHARSRTVTVLQPTAAGWQSVAPIRQQGGDGHELRRFKGMVATATQHDVFLRFWQFCASRTIHFYVYTGEHLEVIIRSYQPGRRRVISGPRGARVYVWNYTMEIEVVARLA